MVETTLFSWLVLWGVLLPLLAVDLFVHRGNRQISRRSALIWSAIWILAGVAFNAFVWIVEGSQKGQEYLAAYLIEKSLSLDNLFVFLIIFQTLGVPAQLQKTVLSWGIFGALVFRLLFILAGLAALEHFEWLTYGFAMVLLLAAFKTVRTDPREQHQNKLLAWLGKTLPVTSRLDGTRFVVREHGKLLATPLLVAIVAVELSDIIFAIDSVPAALSVSRDRFVVYSSNAFAILGLRALYIVIAAAIAKLHYLHYGLGFVLAFAAAKLLLGGMVEISPLASVLVIAAAIGTAVLASLWRTRSESQGSGSARHSW